MIQPDTYVNKPFEITAIQVTEENLQEVSDWIKGEVHVDNTGVFIKVAVRRPLNPRQAQARVGDWVLSTGRGPKVYSDVAFNKGYEKKDEVPVQVLTFAESAAIFDMAVRDLSEGKPVPGLTEEMMRDAAAGKYMDLLNQDAQNQGARLV